MFSVLSKTLCNMIFQASGDTQASSWTRKYKKNVPRKHWRWARGLWKQTYLLHISQYSGSARFQQVPHVLALHRSLRAYVTHILVCSSAGIRAIRRDSQYIAISVCNETIHYTICQISRLAAGEQPKMIIGRRMYLQFARAPT